MGQSPQFLLDNVRGFRVGELAGVATITQLPDVGCRAVMFSAVPANTGNIYIGGSDVTVSDGTTDTTTGLVLDAGVMTPWIPCNNLNQFYRKCDSTADNLTYLAVL